MVISAALSAGRPPGRRRAPPGAARRSLRTTGFVRPDGLWRRRTAAAGRSGLPEPAGCPVRRPGFPATTAGSGFLLPAAATRICRAGASAAADRGLLLAGACGAADCGAKAMGAAARLRAGAAPIADPADHHQQCDDYQSAFGRAVQRRIAECCGDPCQQWSAESAATRRTATCTNPGGSAARRHHARQAEHARAFAAADRSASDRRTRRTAPWIGGPRRHASEFGPEYSHDSAWRTAPGIDPTRHPASDPRPKHSHRYAWRAARFEPAAATRSGRSTSAGALDCDHSAGAGPPWSRRLAAATGSSASQPAGHTPGGAAGGESAAA